MIEAGGCATALLSDDRAYRYELRRLVNALGDGTVCWIMFNPSTADETEDDPTIRRCMDFTRRWGYRDLVVVNVWPFRSADVRGLRKWLREMTPQQFGDSMDNAVRLEKVARESDFVVAAWGAYGQRDGGPRTADRLRQCGLELHALKLTFGGAPYHPLYVKKTAQPEPWPL